MAQSDKLLEDIPLNQKESKKDKEERLQFEYNERLWNSKLEQLAEVINKDTLS